MTVAIVDTTVIVHLLRRYQPALAWFRSFRIFSITSVTWMEVLVGVPNKQAQAETLSLLSSFEIVHLTAADQDWAIQQIINHRFDRSTGMNDALIAAVAYRLRVPLYTHNLKDMFPLIGEQAIQPYGN